MKAKEFLNNFTDLNEFAPVGSGGNIPPRGPKTPGKDPWGGNDGPGDDPYSRPDPKYYSRSIDFFGKFEADHFDKEDFDEKTGVFKGYWDYDGKLKQIAYFKFDDPQQAARDFDDSPGMGWYYEPEDEGLNEFAPAGGDGGDNYGGDIYDILMGYISKNHSDLIDHFGEDLIDTVVSNMISMGAFKNIDPTNEDDLEDAVAEILTQLEEEGLDEGWSEKYKRSIDCNNPKGFSQRAHCQGRQKNEDLEPKDIHNLADKKNVSWDNDPEFMNKSKELTGKSHLDDMNQDELETIKRFINKK